MLTEPLPSTLDARKAAVRGASISGVVSPSDLPRLRGLLAADSGEIDAGLSFSRDEENRYLVRVILSAQLQVNCQRCLEAMPVTLESDNTLAIVWTDEQASQLPRDLDPLIVGEEHCKLRELVEDEIILALPQFSYHDTAECRAILKGFDVSAQQPETAAARQKPFDVLAQLKRGEE